MTGMSTYGIMRIEKRTRSAVYGLQIEANRKETDQYKRDFFDSDIDWAKTKNNVFIKKTENWNKEITRQIKQAGLKERKNSIVLIDGLYTCSPEWFETHSKEEVIQYFKDCLAFHIKEYCGGDKSRLINAVLHVDEQTLHLHVGSTCIYQDEKGMHLSAKDIMGGREDYRLRQDRFYSEVSSRYGMERGEPKRPEEAKSHTTKREWQLATQERQINDLQVQKELLEFDVSSLRAARKYEHGKTEEIKQIKTNIQNEIGELQNRNNELQQKNEELHNSRYEEFQKYKQGIELRKKLELDLNELSKKQNQMQEYLNHNIDAIKDWKNEIQNKINSINEAVAEYSNFAGEMEKQYSQDITAYILNALGDIPDDGPEMDSNPPISGFTACDEEEYEL